MEESTFMCLDINDGKKWESFVVYKWYTVKFKYNRFILSYSILQAKVENVKFLIFKIKVTPHYHSVRREQKIVWIGIGRIIPFPIPMFSFVCSDNEIRERQWQSIEFIQHDSIYDLIKHITTMSPTILLSPIKSYAILFRKFHLITLPVIW